MQICILKQIKMELLQHPGAQLINTRKAGLLTRFMTWCDKQNKNRIAWLAIALAGHGCVLTPITIFFIMMSGNSFVFWPVAMGAMAVCLVVNLAALPTRITVPVFFLSVLADLAIIANCISLGLHFV